ncbi:amino acid ABC transporter substrate-binding protein [Candidatus Aerophobetes bacterium Ae_b3b]|nr:MAG: amino acid ABC transporter substrate-binding protein [Candidatus Aerophobetes bacterium Ae_b3b]
MKKIFIRLTVLLLLLGLATGGGVGATIKIGGLYSLTGALAPFGPPIANGAKLAVDQINEAGGLLGELLEIVVRDTGTAPAVGRDAAAKLVEIDRVPALVGALSSGVTFAVSSITIANQVVQISPASTSPAITDLDDNDFVYRTCVSDAFQGVVNARQAAELLGFKRASVIYTNNAYGKGLAEVFKKAFEERGGKVLAMVPYEEGKPSYRGEIEAAIKGNPEVLQVIAYPVDGNKMLVQAVELGYEGKYIFPDGMKGEAVAAGPASQYLEGSFGTAPGPLESKGAEQFEADYIAEYGKSTVPFRGESYDAVALIALAIQKTGPDFLKMSRAEQGRAIRDNLRAVANPPGVEVTYNEFVKALGLAKAGADVNYQGVAGPCTINENGDMSEGGIEVWFITAGKVISVRTYPVKM